MTAIPDPVTGRAALGGRARRAVARTVRTQAEVPGLVHALAETDDTLDLQALKRFAHAHGVALPARCGLRFVPAQGCAEGRPPPPDYVYCPLCHVAAKGEVTSP